MKRQIIRSVCCLGAVCALFVVLACAEGKPTATPKPSTTPAVAVATATPEPTSTPTPKPTSTTAPTLTPEPTPTPEPTATSTPEPTPTPTVRPTRTPIPTFISPTPKPTATLVPWKTYKHNRDRDVAFQCATGPNFSVDVPPTWVRKSTQCGSVSFESRDEIAEVDIDLENMPNYDSNPNVAIGQIEEDYAEQIWTGIFGTKLTMNVISSKQTTRQGQPALRQTIEIKSDRPYRWCTTTGYRLIILPKSWSTNAKAVWLDATHCKVSTRHYKDLQRIVDSLRLIGPY